MDPSDLDDLYNAPLRDFVQRRNDLAKARRLAGDKDAAKTIKALEKPSLPAWTINRIVRRHRGLVDDLLSAIDDVRQAQLGDPDAPDRLDLASAMAIERRAMQALESCAEHVLTEDGHAVSRSTVDRTMRSIRASAVSPDRRDVMLEARLVSEVEDDGFGGLAAQLAGGIVPPATPRRAPPESAPEPTPKPPPKLANVPAARAAPQRVDPPIDLAAERRRREAEEAEAKARAKAEALRAKRAAIVASRLVEQKLEKDLASAAHDLAEAERRLAAAREQHDGAKAKLDSAVAAREALEQEVDRLDSDAS